MSTGPSGEVESPQTSKRVPQADSATTDARSPAGLGWPGDRPVDVGAGSPAGLGWPGSGHRDLIPDADPNRPQTDITDKSDIPGNREGRAT